MNRAWIVRIIGLVMLVVLLLVLADLQRKLVRLNQQRATTTRTR